MLIILVKGVRSSGKASYFLALFPYVGMGILLVRACTLEGAAAGILYFIKPQFGKLLDPTVSNSDFFFVLKFYVAPGYPTYRYGTQP